MVRSGRGGSVSVSVALLLPGHRVGRPAGAATVAVFATVPTAWLETVQLNVYGHAAAVRQVHGVGDVAETARVHCPAPASTSSCSS
jgi:hypothetical protein